MFKGGHRSKLAVMEILVTGRDVERLCGLVANWQQEYVAEITRLLHEERSHTADRQEILTPGNPDDNQIDTSRNVI